jgi:hypothetical protein
VSHLRHVGCVFLIPLPAKSPQWRTGWPILRCRLASKMDQVELSACEKVVGFAQISRYTRQIVYENNQFSRIANLYMLQQLVQPILQTAIKL